MEPTIWIDAADAELMMPDRAVPGGADAATLRDRLLRLSRLKQTLERAVAEASDLGLADTRLTLAGGGCRVADAIGAVRAALRETDGRDDDDGTVSIPLGDDAMAEVKPMPGRDGWVLARYLSVERAAEDRLHDVWDRVRAVGNGGLITNRSARDDGDVGAPPPHGDGVVYVDPDAVPVVTADRSLDDPLVKRDDDRLRARLVDLLDFQVALARLLHRAHDLELAAAWWRLEMVSPDVDAAIADGRQELARRALGLPRD